MPREFTETDGEELGLATPDDFLSLSVLELLQRLFRADQRQLVVQGSAQAVTRDGGHLAVVGFSIAVELAEVLRAPEGLES